MTDRQILIQIIFETAIFVSANEEPDMLKVTFIDKWMFVGTNNLPIEFDAGRRRQLTSSSEFMSIERVMPTQMQFGGA